MSNIDRLLLGEQVRCLNNTAKAEYEGGHVLVAEKLFEQAHELAKRIDDLNLCVVLRSHLAAMQRLTGKRDEALAGEFWLIGIANDPAASCRVTDEIALESLAASFASFSDNARQLDATNSDDLFRMLRNGEDWMRRIGKDNWIADLRLQRGLILKAQGNREAARHEMEAAVAIKRRQQPLICFTLETHLFQLAQLLIEEPYKEYEIALQLTDEILESQNRHIELMRARAIRSQCYRQMGNLDASLHEALEWVTVAGDGDRKEAQVEALLALGSLHQKRGCHETAAAAFKKAVALIGEEDAAFTSTANSCAWAHYLADADLDYASEIARRGWAKDREEIHMLQTYAAILVRRNKWKEASELVEKWAKTVKEEHIDGEWHDFILLFRDALKCGHAEAVAGMLNRAKWEPLQVAFRKIARGDADLSNVPQHLRHAVAALLSQLKSENVPLVYPQL
jgi:tetratricopeptide (TPR) repeat protein